MWQSYFTPPADAVQTFSVATTRRVVRYTLTREAEETIDWAQGTIETERWRRKSEDGKTEAYVWLAPSLRYMPVKMRVITNTAARHGRGDARLDPRRRERWRGNRRARA